MRIIILYILCFCFGCNVCFSQSSLLDQYLYTINEDSIQLNDFLYEHADYLIWFVGEDIESQQIINNYSTAFEEIENTYDVHIIFVKKHTPNIDIQQDLENGTLSIFNKFQISNFEMFYADKPELFLINNEKELVYKETSIVSETRLEQLISQYLISEYDSILDGFFVECLTNNNACDSLEYLTYSKGQQNKNNLIYTEVKQDQQIHLVREDTDNEALFYYSEDLEDEITLYTFDYQICDTVMLYSVMTRVFHPVVITDLSYADGRIHWVTDLPLECNSDQYLEIISGVGTSSGLLPLFDSESVYSILHCQYQFGEVSYSISDCDPDKPNDNQVSLFPNPAVDHISLIGRFSDISIEALFDMRGRHVQLSLLDDMTVSTQDLPHGIYILRASVDGIVQYFQFVKM